MDDLVRLVKERLKAAADPEKARGMAAYMKTDMPFYGVQKPEREKIAREMVAAFEPANRGEYHEAVGALWAQPHREEKYLAISFARSFPRYVTSSSLPLYRKLIVEGAWWDFVDEVAIRLVGHVLRGQRARTTATIDRWIDHPDMWLRRTVLICQIQHKDETDEARLFDYCRRRAHEREFFIRKAIGWALRDYAYTAPKAVRSFLEANREGLSGLSYREAGKHL